jgi:uncharacterized protein YbjT (DUF2867 family)
VKVLVTGGRGLLGREVVRQLSEGGHQPLAAGRRGPVVLDVRTGEGLEAALAGVDAVIHCASNSRGRDAREVEVEGTARLVQAARSASVVHLVYISIVGVERVPLAYYRYKLHAEKVVEHGRVPWTILRATQFFPFQERLFMATPVLLAPGGFVAQPVDVGEVAARLIRALEEGPATRVHEFGGPEIRTVESLVRSLVRVRGLRRPVLRPRLPGPFAAAVRAGGLTCPDGERGRLTWERWLTGT